MAGAGRSPCLAIAGFMEAKAVGRPSDKLIDELMPLALTQETPMKETSHLAKWQRFSNLFAAHASLLHAVIIDLGVSDELKQIYSRTSTRAS